MTSGHMNLLTAAGTETDDADCNRRIATIVTAILILQPSKRILRIMLLMAATA